MFKIIFSASWVDMLIKNVHNYVDNVDNYPLISLSPIK